MDFLCVKQFPLLRWLENLPVDALEEFLRLCLPRQYLPEEEDIVMFLKPNFYAPENWVGNKYIHSYFLLSVRMPSRGDFVLKESLYSLFPYLHINQSTLVIQYTWINMEGERQVQRDTERISYSITQKVGNTKMGSQYISV